MRRGKLGPADGGAEFGDLVTAGITAIATDDIGQRGPGHGWLLGSERQAEDLKQQETYGVIRAYQNAFDEGRPFVSDNVKFQCRGEDGKQPATQGGTPHVPIFLAAVGDVVFSTVSCTFHGFTGQQVQVLTDEGGHTGVLKQGAHQRVEQLAHGNRGFAGGLNQGRGEHLHPVERGVHAAQIEDHRRADPCVFHVQSDERQFSRQARMDSSQRSKRLFGGSEASDPRNASVAKMRR